MTKMRLLQICVSYTFLSVFFFQLQKYEANACSLGCTCTTIPARDGDAVDEDDEGGDVTGDNVGDEGELTLPQATRGRKVSCSNNPYPFTSIEEVRTAITIPLDTIYFILERYVLLGLARSMKPFFDLTTFQPDVNHDEEMEAEGEHWRRCIFYTNKALGLATAAVYVNATTIDASLAQITTLVTYVKRAFKEYLLRKIWMDAKTRGNAEKKLDEMIEKVSYPSFILNNTFLSEFYTNFTIGDNWFNNLLNWRRITITNMVNSLSKPFDRLNSWINPPVTVESDYSPVRNDIIFPIALFHLPIYSHAGPSALNFGAIGSIIGHEITHAFDIQGRQYDGQGRLRDWWDPVTAGMFNETTHCMKDQYDHFKIGNMTIHGAQTLEENIADNGGLRAAHIAYELWMQEHGEEEPIAGLDLDARQLFFVSYAQLYCSKWSMSGVTDFLMRDAHSPGPYRIEGALSNSLAFSDVFKCSYVAKYNPPIKCRVW